MIWTWSSSGEDADWRVESGNDVVVLPEFSPVILVVAETLEGPDSAGPCQDGIEDSFDSDPDCPP